MIKTQVNETLYRIAEQEGKGWNNGHYSDPIGYGEMSCLLVVFKPEDDDEHAVYHTVRNIDLFIAGELYKDIIKIDSGYVGLIAFNDMTVWSVLNPGPHIDMLYTIDTPDDGNQLYATMLYPGMYEQNPKIFRIIHQYTSARGHYTPATLRINAFEDFNKILQQLASQFEGKPSRQPQYQEHRIPIYDPQTRMTDLYEWNDVKLNVKSLSYIAMAKAMRNKPQ